MAVTIRVELGALPQALVDHRDAPWVRAAREAAIKAAGQRLEPIMVRHAPSGGTGLLRQFTKFTYDEFAGQPSGFVGPTGPPSLYARWANDGRAPGKMPPWRPGSGLHLFATRVLGDPSAAFPVALSIARRGTRAYRDHSYGHFVEKTMEDGAKPAQVEATAAVLRVMQYPEKHLR